MNMTNYINTSISYRQFGQYLIDITSKMTHMDLPLEYNGVKICDAEYNVSDILILDIIFKNKSVKELNFQNIFEKLHSEIPQNAISAFAKSKLLACTQFKNEMLFVVQSYVYQVGGPKIACAMVINSQYFNTDFMENLEYTPKLDDYVTIKAIPQPERIDIHMDSYACLMLPNYVLVSFLGDTMTPGFCRGFVYYAHRENDTFGDFRILSEMTFYKNQKIDRILLTRRFLYSETLEAWNPEWKKICAGRVDTEVLKKECRNMRYNELM